MKNTNKKGFTLVELVIVIAVVAILAGVMIGTFSNVVKNAKISKELQSWKYTVDEAYLEYVSTYNEEPLYVEKTESSFEFINKTNVTTDDYNLTVGTYVELEKVDDTTSVCLIKTASGLRVVTGTISGNELAYENVTGVAKAGKYVAP